MHMLISREPHLHRKGALGERERIRKSKAGFPLKWLKAPPPFFPPMKFDFRESCWVTLKVIKKVFYYTNIAPRADTLTQKKEVTLGFIFFLYHDIATGIIVQNELHFGRTVFSASPVNF